jgi:chromate reductase, NAD(P)H dehydrogenase (quinone)
MNIVAIAGALRAGSFNLRLARALASRAPSGTTIEVVTLHGVPLYDGDEEAKSGLPAAVVALKDKVVASDGLLLVSPEYNSGIPGVMKNGIDWMSRPAADIARVFKGKPVGIVGATPGPAGTRLAQTAWLPVLRTLGMTPWFGAALYVDSAGKVLDEQGNVIDPKTEERIRTYVDGFAGFVSTLVRGREASTS